MITSPSVKNFSNSRVMKQRFDQAAARVSEKNETIDKLESMAEGFLTLDQTEFDQDKDPGSVAVADDKGIIAYAQANPFGGVMSFDYLNEKADKVEEFSISMGMTGTTYVMDTNGLRTEVYQDGNGLLAIMESLDSIAPPATEEPKESDKPKEDEKPQEK